MHFGPMQDFAVSRNASYLLMSGNGFFILQFRTEKKKSPPFNRCSGCFFNKAFESSFKKVSMEISCSPYFPVLTLFKLRVELEFPPYVRSDFLCNANVRLKLNWDLFPILTVQIVLDTLLESHSSLGTGAGLSYDFCVWVFFKVYLYFKFFKPSFCLFEVVLEKIFRCTD